MQGAEAWPNSIISFAYEKTSDFISGQVLNTFFTEAIAALLAILGFSADNHLADVASHSFEISF